MRKHAEYIIAWANGAKIEYKLKTSDEWQYAETPMWYHNTEYRIQPEPEMTHFQRYTMYFNANEHRFNKIKDIVTIHPQYKAMGEVLVRFVNHKPVEVVQGSTNAILGLI